MCSLLTIVPDLPQRRGGDLNPHRNAEGFLFVEKSRLIEGGFRVRLLNFTHLK